MKAMGGEKYQGSGMAGAKLARGKSASCSGGPSDALSFNSHQYVALVAGVALAGCEAYSQPSLRVAATSHGTNAAAEA